MPQIADHSAELHESPNLVTGQLAEGAFLRVCDCLQGVSFVRENVCTVYPCHPSSTGEAYTSFFLNETMVGFADPITVRLSLLLFLLSTVN